MSRFTRLFSILLLIVAGLVAWWIQQDTAKPLPSAAVTPAKPPGHSRVPANPKRLAAQSRWSGLTEDSLPASQRLEMAVQISSTDVDQEDAAVLFSLMRHTPRGGGEEDWYVIVNEVMEQMRRCGLGSEQYAAQLGAILADPSQPDVLRDYALQHLALWIGPGNPENVPHEENPESISQALSQITTAIESPAASLSSLPGTALMALANISPHLPADSINAAWKSLEPYLQQVIATGTHTQLSTRVSAIQAVSMTRQQSYLPAIRSLAASDDTDPSIRLSSIASLGFYADPEDQRFLETLSKQDTRYKYAAQSALQRFASR